MREAKGWTQSELAERASTRQGTVSALEIGQTRRLDLDIIERLAHALGVDPLDLFVSTKK